ncbi:hypothetical protein [Clostridium sp. UBA1652]|uniref:hypothetical protein n=1 Tax=Clostridium sp. UBA1652 TaxID=1946348 RepID=UPI00257BFF3E|nr:hypothetical protein [Clostridium sp. UBA1652]
MQSQFNTILEYIYTPLIFLSALFDSILLENEKRNQKYKYLLRNIIQIVYCILISLLLGIMLGFFTLMLLALRYSFSDTAAYGIILIPIILCIILIWILFLNYDDKNFNLPKIIFSICWFLINVNLKSLIFETIINILIFPIILMTIFMKFLSTFDISYNEALILTIIIMMFYFLISLIIYSETTQNKIKRLARQSVMWIILFVLVSIFTIYQIKISINDNQSVSNVVNIALAVLGLAFTMTTIVDKVKSFYDESFKLDKKLIKKRLRFFRNKYHIKKYIKKVDEEKNQFIGNLKYIYHQWRSGEVEKD